jgi:Helix-turn-helix domain
MTVNQVDILLKVSQPQASTNGWQPQNVTTEKGRTKGSGNVFADLGLPNADQELLKARLTATNRPHHQGPRYHPGRKLGKSSAFRRPHVSALARNRSGNFSVGRLIDFLTALGQDVEITVRPTRKDHGQMSVVVT